MNEKENIALPSAQLSNEDTHVFDDMKDVDPQLSDDMLRRKLRIPDWTKLEAYSDLRMIGMGGIGTVFAAKEPVLYRNVAIKMLRQENRRNPSALENLLREARMTAQIDHPNVVPVYSIGVFDELGAYFTMKRVIGKNLSTIIRAVAEKKPKYVQSYSLRRMLEIFISVCNGIAFAHSKGIIHRDLKPGNIMLGDYGEVMVMDWGMALYRSDRDSGKGPHRIDLREQEISFADRKRKTISGTPAYMSPEQVRGNNDEINERSDQYSLGAILYSILTLRPSPFNVSESTDKLLGMVLYGKFKPPRRNSLRRHVPRELEAICLKAMSVDPADRYSSVESLRDDVRNYLEMYPVDVYNSPLRRLIKYCRRRPLIPAMLAGAMLSTVGFFIYDGFDRYNQYSGLLKIAAESIGSAEIEHRKVHRIIGMLESPDTQNRNEISRLNLEFFVARQRFVGTMFQALNALNRAEDVGAPPRLFKDAARQILADMLCFYGSTGDTEALRRTVGDLNNGMREVFNQIMLEDPVLALKTQMVLAGKSRINIDAPAGMTIFAEKLNPGSEKPEEFKLGVAPFHGKLDSGAYIFSVNDCGRKVCIPAELRAGGLSEIKFIIPEKFPDGTVMVNSGNYYADVSGANTFGWRRHLDAFLIDRRSVTIAEYRNFWNQCDAAEREHFMPSIIRDRKVVPLWGPDGRLVAPYTPDMPVVGVSVEAAKAYCLYMSRKYDMECRLPTVAELEKAGRGPDRRLYVWGNDFDPAKAVLRGNPMLGVKPCGVPAGTFETDRSPYGVYDLSGNVRDLAYESDEKSYVAYGGSYNSPGYLARCGSTSPVREDGEADVGFRCVYPLPPQEKMKKTEK